MESNSLCERCNVFTARSHLFNCHHSLCSQCMARIIAFSYCRVNSIFTRDHIQIVCPCQNGTKTFPVADIHQLIKNNSNTQGLLSYCLKKCFYMHELKSKDHYCYNCQEFICPSCHSQKQAKLFIHDDVSISDYAEDLRTQIPVCDVIVQVNQIENLWRDFRSQVGQAVDLAMMKIDKRISFVQEYKVIYNMKMKHILERAGLVIDLSKFYYFDFHKRQTIRDLKVNYLSLSLSLSTRNIELDESEKHLQTIKEDFHKEVSLRKWCKNTVTLIGHKWAVRSLVQLSDGRTASGSDDKTIKVWEVQEKEFKNTLTLTGHSGAIFCLISLTDGRLASGSDDKTIKVWEVKLKYFKNTRTLFGHNGGVRSLIQLKDGRLASGSDDLTIKVWEMTNINVLKTLTLTGHTFSICSLTQMKDGTIAYGSLDGTIKLWKERENAFNNSMTLIGHKNCVRSLIKLEDGRFASGSDDRKIKVWDVKVKENQVKNSLTLTGHNDAILSLIQLLDGRIASGSKDKTCKIWEMKEKEFKNTLTLTGHHGWVNSVIQMKDERIASSSDDKTIKVWE